MSSARVNRAVQDFLHGAQPWRVLDAAALCSHLLGPGSVHAFLAEHRRRLFPDDMFEDLFPSGRGRPSVPADVIATVIVLQALDGLSRFALQGLQGARFHQPQPTSLAAPHVGRRVVALRIRAHT